MTSRRVVWQLNGGFVLAGMATTLLGPLLPLVSAHWGLTDADAGALFTAQFTGALTATSFAAVVARAFGRGRALAAGFALLALGVGVLGVASRPVGLVAAAVYGLGLGLVLPLTNIAVAALYPARAASALSLVNVSWGIGAVLWPLIVRAVAAPARPAPATTALAIGCAMFSLLWAVAPRASAGEPPTAATGDRAAITAQVPIRVVLAYGAIIALYVGAETSIGGWVAEVARRMGASQSTWALAPTAFWGAQTAGRLLVPLVLTRISELAVLRASVLASGAIVLLMATGTAGPATIVASAGLTGLGLAAIFPLLWAGITRDVAPYRQAVLGPLFAAGGVGGAVVPWLVGAVSDAGAGLAAALLVPLSALVIVFALLPIAWRAP